MGLTGISWSSTSVIPEVRSSGVCESRQPLVIDSAAWIGEGRQRLSEGLECQANRQIRIIPTSCPLGARPLQTAWLNWTCVAEARTVCAALARLDPP